MGRTQLPRFADAIQGLGASGIDAPEFCLGIEGALELRYIPFEHVNPAARLVIVGITPGPNQMELAYAQAQSLLMSGASHDHVLAEVKKAGAFGGPAMRPNLLKMLRHFQFDTLLGISDVATLWGTDAHLLHATSVVPHAAFRLGKGFNGAFDEVLKSPLLKQCFLDGFVASLAELQGEALFVALGPCPQAALDWCVAQGHLQPHQVLGSFCHPSSQGSSAVAYYLREKTREDLKANDPVRHRTNDLDAAYRQMAASIAAHLQELGHHDRAVSLPAVPLPDAVVRSAAEKTAKAPALAKPRRTAEDNKEGAEDEARQAELTALVDAIVRAGHVVTKQTKKVAEFETASREVLYLIKTTSTLNTVNVIVDPKHAPARLQEWPGVSTVTSKHRFHSHMTRFPKRRNKGEAETAYGWQVTTASLGDFERFLSGLR